MFLFVSKKRVRNIINKRIDELERLIHKNMNDLSLTSQQRLDKVNLIYDRMILLEKTMNEIIQ